MAYLKSTQVKVYPSAYRGTNDNNELYNPEAQLNTEFNITNLCNTNQVKSYVLSWRNSILKCIINGYYFELTLDATTLAQFETNIYATIKVLPANPAVDDSTNTQYAAYTLVPDTQTESGIPSKLDDKASGNFIGITLNAELTNPTVTGVYNLWILYKNNRGAWMVPADSYVRNDSSTIMDPSSGRPITEIFETQSLLTGDANVKGDLTVEGTSNLSSTNVNGDLVVNNTLHVKKACTFDSDIQVQGTISSSGSVDTPELDTDILKASSDFSIELRSSIIPNNNETLDLGESSKQFENIYGKTFHGTLEGDVPELREYINETNSSLAPTNTPIDLSTESSLIFSDVNTARYSFHLMLEDTTHKVGSSTLHSEVIIDFGQVCWGIREWLGGSQSSQLGANFKTQVYAQQSDLASTNQKNYSYLIEIFDKLVEGKTNLYADVYYYDFNNQKWTRLSAGNLFVSNLTVVS